MSRTLIALLAELLIFLAAIILMLDYGPIDVHYLIAATCGAAFLILIRLAIMLGTAGAARLMRRPAGQMWKSGGDWWQWR